MKASTFFFVLSLARKTDTRGSPQGFAIVIDRHAPDVQPKRATRPFPVNENRHGAALHAILET